MDKAPLDDRALDQLFREARTFNGYQNRDVDDVTLEAIWELAKMGPTSANCLPARIVWVKSGEQRERLAGLVSEGNAEKVRNAPVTAVIGMDLRFHDLLPELFPHADAKSWFEGDQPLIEGTAFRNSSLQGAYVILAARALGLDTGPMSGFDSDAVRAAFFADQPNVAVNFLTTLGYGDPASVWPRSPRPEFARFNRVV